MPIAKSGSTILYTEGADKRLFEQTQVVSASDFAVCHPVNHVKQLKFEVSNSTEAEGSVTIKATVGTGASTIDLASVFGAQKFMVPAGGLAKAGAGAGWVVAVGDNISLVTCPASQTASTLVVPIVGLKVGQTISSFHLVGQIESAGGTVLVDADLRKMTAAAADVTDASVGAITQLSVTADTIMSATNTNKASLTEVVGADETFYVLITATTAGSTDIALQGVAITVTEA